MMVGANLTFIILSLLLISLAHCSVSFNGHRLLQWSSPAISGGATMGSPRSSVNLRASSSLAPAVISSSPLQDRRLLLLPYEEYMTSKDDILGTVKPDAVILFLNSSNIHTQKPNSTAELEEWERREEELGTMTLKIPFYFIDENESPIPSIPSSPTAETIRSIYRSVHAAESGENNAVLGGFMWLYNFVFRDDYHFVASASEPTPLAQSLSLHNIQSRISSSYSSATEETTSSSSTVDSTTTTPTPAPPTKGKKKKSSSSASKKNPTIGIIAHYDDLSIAPDLTRVGVSAASSATAAVIELTRLFNRLYNERKSSSTKYDLVFLLSSGGKLNYVGTKNWVEEQGDDRDSITADSLDFVVTIHSLHLQPLYLHASKVSSKAGPEVEAAQKKIEEIFINSAKKLSVPLDVKVSNLTKKSKDSESASLGWEHEIFTKRRIPAVTISSYDSAASNYLDQSSILESYDSIKLSTLRSNIKLIAEALAHYIYNLEDQIEIFKGGEEEYLREFLNEVNQFPRTPSSLASSSPSKAVTVLEKLLALYSDSVKVASFAFPYRDFQFYNPTSTQLYVYRVKPFLFDVVLMLMIGVYLVALSVLLSSAFGVAVEGKGVFQTIREIKNDFIALFKSEKKPKRR